MHTTEDTVARMAALARLELSEAETARLTGELGAIVTYMDVLNTLPAGEDDSHLPPVDADALREDICLPSLPRDTLLACAPEQDGAYVLVPRTVE